MALIGIAQNSTPTRVFRKVESILKQSDSLKGAVESWRTWQARDGKSGTPPAPGRFTVELFPRVENQQWGSPDSHLIDLDIEVTMTFSSTDAGDYLDAWMAVIQAVYPPDQAQRLALQRELVAVGCKTGEPLIMWPSPVPEFAAESGVMELMGQIRYEVRLQINT